MARDSLDSDKKTFNDAVEDLVDRLQEAAGQPVENFAVEGEPISASIERVRARIGEHRIRVSQALLEGSTSIQRDLLERLCNADPEMAAARYPPPIRSRSKSFDAVCCALEQIRRGRLSDVKAAEWLSAKSGGLICQKIAKSVLSLAKPGYRRNGGKHRKDSPKYKGLALDVLDSHPAWLKYRKLIEERFCSHPFAALLLASEYHLEDTEGRNRYMPNGLKEFLERLEFYEKEVNGYSSLIRDEGAIEARSGWGY